MDCMQSLRTNNCLGVNSFQYRKRYGLHAMSTSQSKNASVQSFNTASGMDCMQCTISVIIHISIVRFNTASGMDCMQFFGKFLLGRLVAFQYRKRYGLHAMQMEPIARAIYEGFNTASGMDCMQ